MATAHKSRVLDMTQGDPFRLVLQFSMPLFCSNLLRAMKAGYAAPWAGWSRCRRRCRWC